MNLNDFTSALSASLVERGIAEDVVRSHITRLIPTLSEEDLREIASFTSPDDFKDISDATASMLAMTSTVRISAVRDARKEQSRTVSSAKRAPKPVAERNPNGYAETPEGKKRFILTTVCASPLFAIAFVLYFALWVIAFAAEIAVIVFSIAALIACAAGGVGSAVGGVIYGVITLGSVPSAGVYEIGFGIVIAGVTFLACILIYNFALRFMPFGVKKTAEFFNYCLGRVRELLKEYRRRCFTR